MDTEYLDNMERAEEFVKAARLCYDNQHYNAAATRAYYGALHAGVAALVTLGKDMKVRSLMTGRTHEKVPAMFDNCFVQRTKMFPKQKGVLLTLRDRRHDADYKAGVNQTRALDCVTKAEEMLSIVKGEMINAKMYW